MTLYWTVVTIAIIGMIGLHIWDNYEGNDDE